MAQTSIRFTGCRAARAPETWGAWGFRTLAIRPTHRSHTIYLDRTYEAAPWILTVLSCRRRTAMQRRGRRRFVPRQHRVCRTPQRVAIARVASKYGSPLRNAHVKLSIVSHAGTASSNAIGIDPVPHAFFEEPPHNAIKAKTVYLRARKAYLVIPSMHWVKYLGFANRLMSSSLTSKRVGIPRVQHSRLPSITHCPIRIEVMTPLLDPIGVIRPP